MPLPTIFLFDDPLLKQQLKPFTFLRPISHIRVGILTLQEKWEKRGFQVGGNLCEKYLTSKFPIPSSEGEVLFLNGAAFYSGDLALKLDELPSEQPLFSETGRLIAVKTAKSFGSPNEVFDFAGKLSGETLETSLLSRPWQIFQWNRAEIITDFEMLTEGKKSAPLTDPHTIVYGKENLFLEEGAQVRAAIINAEEGPVYIGKNAVIHEGCMIHGAFALGESAHLNMGAKIKGDTTIGPFCKVGGEVSNSVLFAYSNKGHDGFLGNSVLAEWCNLGADTNTSNLKNNYSSVKVWDYASGQLENTGLQFCGLLMGDHSKSGINTMFNTGTVAGIAANVFDSGFPPKFIPSFSWGGANGFQEYRLDKMYETAERMMSRRNVPLTQADKEIIRSVMEETAAHRSDWK